MLNSGVEGPVTHLDSAWADNVPDLIAAAVGVGDRDELHDLLRVPGRVVAVLEVPDPETKPLKGTQTEVIRAI